MIKKKNEGISNKELMILKSKDKLYSFMLGNNIRGAVLNGTHLVNEMRVNHELGILETLVLGHAYMGISLMTSNIKKDDRLAFKIDCSGPIKGLYVESNSYGEVRGYLKANPIPLDKSLESYDMSPFFETGFLEVIHYPKYAKQPYVGKVALKYKNIAPDLANYYHESQQTPTYFNLSVKFDKEGIVTGAGGLLLQVMPDADKNIDDHLEEIAKDLPSIGELFANKKSPEDLINNNLKKYSPKILSNKRVEFFCPCSKKSMLSMIDGLDKNTREDIAKNGPFPLDIKCHNCNTTYSFSKEELVEEQEKGKREKG